MFVNSINCMRPVFARVMYIFIPDNYDFQIGKLLIFFIVCCHMNMLALRDMDAISDKHSLLSK